MTPNDAHDVRPLTLSDRPQWDGLWAAYLETHGSTRPKAVFDTPFSRLIGSDLQKFNASARKLCDRVGTLSPFITYDRG